MNDPKTYSAEDLLRYAHGQMPVAERHALEKAALEDPFLAEALDGYLEIMGNRQQTTVLPELNALREIIAEKAEDKKQEKQVPIVSIWRNKWLQSAVAAVFLFGTAWWLYSISNMPKEENKIVNTQQIAQNQPPILKDSVKSETTSTQVPAAVLAPKKVVEQKAIAITTIKAAPEISEKKVALVDRKTFFADETKPKTDTTLSSTQHTDMAFNQSATSRSNTFKKENFTQSTVIGYGTTRKSDLENLAASKKPTFVFQGRILDANNNPLPFSSIMVPGEDFGTYSDGDGYFNFVYTDSILPVHAKSLGFEAQDFNMLANKKENRIVLNEDKNLDKSLTYMRSEKQKRAVDFKPTIVKVDSISSTIEPFIGWKNYDLYLANNNRISDFAFSGNRSVLLSFDISKDGNIKNITVDRSQGKDLDAEAIRLLKEGPKWKTKKDGEKGKVEVKF